VAPAAIALNFVDVKKTEIPELEPTLPLSEKSLPQPLEGRTARSKRPTAVVGAYFKALL
jgi:hypothetical protein